MYRCDFEMMEQQLYMRRKTGVLRAEFPTGIARIKEHCYVEMKVVAGQVLSCHIHSQSGRQLTDDAALRVLHKAGTVEWIFTEPGQHSSPLPALHNTFPAPHTPLPEVPSSARLTPLPDVPASPARPSPSTDPGMFLSHTLRKTTTTPPATLTRAQRQVFLLIDGKRSIEQIAALIALAPEGVRQVCRDLLLMNLITFGPEAPHQR